MPAWHQTCADENRGLVTVLAEAAEAKQIEPVETAESGRFQPKALRRRAHALIQFTRLLHGNEFSGKPREPRQKRRLGQHTSRFVTSD